MFTATAKKIHDFLAQPFNSQGSALNWIAFVGLIVIGAFLWNMVLLAIFTKTETV